MTEEQRDPRDILARLRGKDYHAAETPPPPPTSAFLTMPEVELLIQKWSDYERRIQRQEAQIMSDRYQMLLVEVAKLDGRLTKLEEKNAKPDLIPGVEFPDMQNIKLSKIRCQIFHNQGKGNILRNLKIELWTCPTKDIPRYEQGTYAPFFMPMFTPGRALRKCRATDLDYLGVGNAKLVGCLQAKKYQRAGYAADQAAIIEQDDRLTLVIRDEAIDMGVMEPAGGAPKEPKGRWKLEWEMLAE